MATSGTLDCWGVDDGSFWDDGQVTDVPPSAYLSIASGAYHSCAISDSSLLQCWGRDDSGQVSDLPL